MFITLLAHEATHTATQTGIGLGSAIAIVCSWQRNRSILWELEALRGWVSRCGAGVEWCNRIAHRSFQLSGFGSLCICLQSVHLGFKRFDDLIGKLGISRNQSLRIRNQPLQFLDFRLAHAPPIRKLVLIVAMSGCSSAK